MQTTLHNIQVMLNYSILMMETGLNLWHRFKLNILASFSGIIGRNKPALVGSASSIITSCELILARISNKA